LQEKEDFVHYNFIITSIVVSVLWIPFSIWFFKRAAAKEGICYSLLPPFIINPILAFNVILGIVYVFMMYNQS
tara:strand:- start:1099 stop:1317 length:219 start_codon:yes stop_codon:yes gene_type:complete